MATKVKDIKVSEYNGKKSYIATLEDGTSGYFDIKQSGELVVGQEVEYTKEEKTNKKGGKYNLLTITSVTKKQESGSQPPLPPKQGTPSVASLSKQQVKVQAFFKAADKIVELVIAGKVPWEKFNESHKELVTYFDGEIDQLFSE